MNYKDEYRRWIESPAITESERRELLSIEGDEDEMESRFVSLLAFGTAGLRGTMGVGTCRMNTHVIRHATQAFAEVVLESDEYSPETCVAICFDCRINSDVFAKEAACVMAANGIKVRIFEDMRPTPELSFAIREYKCIAGINVTASHNPKEYNGYKVYWSDGAQLPPKEADEVAKKMEKLDMFSSVKTMDFDSAVSQGLITVMGKETDELFLSNVMAMANDPEMMEKAAESFHMVYTPFHGTGRELIPEVLHRAGLKNVHCVPEQMIKDGNFPTVVSPNPENPEGFYLAVELADKVGADFILGSDPDADRVGLMVRGKDGKFVPLTGNQTGALFLEYLIGAMKRKGTLPKNAVALKTIVSSEMCRAIAEANGVTCFDTFTGFKFMAEKKKTLEETGEGRVIFSYEESYGYMVGDYVRDKDAVTAALLMSEMAAWYFLRGMTLLDALDELYEKYGAYVENTINLVMPGLDGARKMKELMDGLRENPPADICGNAVRLYRDYMPGSEIDAVTGAKREMELRDSNVLSFTLQNGTAILVRPSGTEPKVKVYILAHGDSMGSCLKQAENYSRWANALAE